MATKIFPTSEELSIVDSCLPCSEEDCTKVFTSRSNLNLHLTKTHHRSWTPDNTLKEYYCPDSECIFNSEKYFKSLKLLKQHYLKVHGDKQFICDTCNKGFPTLSSKNRHTNYCGINFTCCECDAGYLSYESLLTHGRRKKHKVLEKTAYSPTAVKSTGTILINQSVVKSTKKEMFIVPKTSASFQFISVVPNIIKSASNPTLEKSSQTDLSTRLPKFKTKQTQIFNKRTSKESQTLELRRTHSSAETQTVGDYVSKKPKLSNSDIIFNRKNSDEGIEQKSTKTQTHSVSSQSQSCNTSFELNEDEFVTTPIIHKSNSATQTAVLPEVLFSISTATHDSIHTDTSDLNFEFIHSSSQTCFNEDMSVFNSSNYFNCNIETQTDFFDNVLLNYDSNPENETNCSFDDDLENYCQKAYDDDILNTIHTQTVFDDIARSVESQTMMSHAKIKSMGCKDMANMETQTDNNFQKLLEEINA